MEPGQSEVSAAARRIWVTQRTMGFRFFFFLSILKYVILIELVEQKGGISIAALKVIL